MDLKKFLKKEWIWILSIMLLSMASGCENEDSATGIGSRNRNMNVASSSNVQSSINEVNQDKKSYSVGEVIHFQNTELTIKNVEKSEGNENIKPIRNRVFIIITVQIKNTGKDKKIPYRYYDFELKSNNGKRIEESISAIDIDTTLTSGELAPKESVTGTLAYELPFSESTGKLSYFSSLGDSAVIDIEY